METITAYKHIVRKIDTYEPIVRGTRISVRDIVENWRMGLSPEEIPSIYPQVTLAQVFGALAYYQDNKEEIEKFIEQNRVPENLSGTHLSR